MSDVMKKTLQSIRRICADLRPKVLDDLGLFAAIDWLVGDFGKTTGLPCRLSTQGSTARLLPEQATDVFRILQEGLTNAARHARASRITVTISARRNVLLAKVVDDGIGISPKVVASPQSFGLAGMRERTFRWNGTIDIQGRPGKGTAIFVRIPVKS
jgi:signal transduction histidine kinase